MKNKSSYIYNKVKSIPLLFTLIVLVSCGAEDSISRKFACQFTFQTQNHPGNTLEIALNGLGSYTFVSTSYKNGTWHIYSTPNDGSGKTEDIPIIVETEKKITNLTNLGANNGIIIGHTNFNGTVAYDRQCPNCINQYGGTNYPLDWDADNRQKVTCKKCHRTYNLEYGSIEAGGDGDRLMQYLLEYKDNSLRTGKVIVVHN